MNKYFDYISNRLSTPSCNFFEPFFGLLGAFIGAILFVPFAIFVPFFRFMYSMIRGLFESLE